MFRVRRSQSDRHSHRWLRADRRGHRRLVHAAARPQGFQDVLHGGIVATALDEMLAWTATLLEDVFVFTGKMELRFRKQAPWDAAYRLEGYLDERRGRRLLLHGNCQTGDGAIVAEASGLYLVNGTLAPTT